MQNSTIDERFNLLCDAVYYGDLSTVRDLLPKGPIGSEGSEGQININQLDEHGYSPLHWASRVRFLEVVKKLLNVPGVDINILDEANRTPLHLAAFRGHLRTIETWCKSKY